MPIQIEHLTHTYMPDSPFTTVALKDVNLTIEDGEFIGLLGHTGSGKTTLVQHLNGLIRPTEGKVIVDGLDIKTIAEESVHRLFETLAMRFDFSLDEFALNGGK